MSNQKHSDTVSKNTAYTMAAVCLLLGFLGGVVVSAVKSSSTSAAFRESGHSHVPDRSSEIEAAKAAAESQPENPDLWNQLGNLYFDTGQTEKAIEAYRTSLDLQPNNANVWTDLGVMYRRGGQPQKAIDSFAKAAEIDQSHEIARFNMGIVRLHDLNDPQGAIVAWEDLLKINPVAVTPSGQSVDSIVAELKRRNQNAQTKQPSKN